MRVAIDASVLAYLFDAEAAPPKDAEGKPVADCQLRLEHLISELQQARATLIIPAPALSEVLVYAGEAAQNWLSTLTGTRCCQIAPFDTMAAVECAALAAERVAQGRRSGLTKAKAKFDEQIFAIAMVQQADEILSDDADIRWLAGQKLPVRGIVDLPLPPTSAQMTIDWDNVPPEPVARPARIINLDEPSDD